MKEVWLMIRMLLPADPATEMVFPELVTSLPVYGSYFLILKKSVKVCFSKKVKLRKGNPYGWSIRHRSLV